MEDYISEVVTAMVDDVSLLVHVIRVQLEVKAPWRRVKRAAIPLLVAVMNEDEEAIAAAELRRYAADPTMRRSLAYGWLGHFRAALKSALCTLAVVPWWSVRMSAVARSGKHWPYRGFGPAFRDVVRRHGRHRRHHRRHRHRRHRHRHPHRRCVNYRR